MEPSDNPKDWNLIKIEVSTNKKKKYDAFLENKKTKQIKKVSFGARGMDQYFDKIGYYFANDHLDKERRKKYYARHGRKADKYTAKWFSSRYLW